VDNIVYEVDCALIVVKEGDVDIGLSFIFPLHFPSSVQPFDLI
jgi:hypothetical protein